MKRRVTRQREAVLMVLRRTSSHPTADQICVAVRQQIPSISKGTVCRNLEVLNEGGLVSELNLNGTVSRFEIKQDRHCHLRCERCGRVLDLTCPFDQELDARVATQTGLKISSHQLEFRGVCPECQQQATATKSGVI